MLFILLFRVFLELDLDFASDFLRAKVGKYRSFGSKLLQSSSKPEKQPRDKPESPIFVRLGLLGMVNTASRLHELGPHLRYHQVMELYGVPPTISGYCRRQGYRR